MSEPEVEDCLLSATLDVKERLRLLLVKRDKQPSFGVSVAEHHVLDALPVCISHIQHAINERCDFSWLQLATRKTPMTEANANVSWRPMERLSKFTIFSKLAVRMVEDDVRGCGGTYSRVGGVEELKHDAYFSSIYRLIPALLQDRPQNGLKPCGSPHSWKYCDYASGNGIGKLDVGFRAGRSHTWKPALGRLLPVTEDRPLPECFKQRHGSIVIGQRGQPTPP